MENSDLILYAKWVENPAYRVIYSINEGSGTVPVDINEYYTDDTAVILDKSENFQGPILQDGIKKRFLCWNTRVNGSGNDYSAGETIQISDADIVLYAKWSDSVIGGIGPAGGIIFMIS